MGYRWQPLQRANIVCDEPPELIAAAMKLWSLSEAEARKRLDDEHQRLRTEYWVNDLYQVAVSHHPDNIVQLNIRRRDGVPCIRDWRHFQQIKNELVGEECEGIELYPAESRKVDTSNKYHLWCIADPTFRFGLPGTRRCRARGEGTPGHATAREVTRIEGDRRDSFCLASERGVLLPTVRFVSGSSPGHCAAHCPPSIPQRSVDQSNDEGQVRFFKSG